MESDSPYLELVIPTYDDHIRDFAPPKKTWQCSPSWLKYLNLSLISMVVTIYHATFAKSGPLI
jgi:D-alanyl-lipoteichoic acid acyltransferase DltB (MBOAT superfamily)